MIDNLVEIVLATGALGTAAFGIVEALKWTPIGEIGFRSIRKVLGPIWKVLGVAYGEDFENLLRYQYKGAQEDLSRTLRQGVRIGLKANNAPDLAVFLGMIDEEKLSQAAQQAEVGEDLPDDLRNVLGRFELAVDTRIDAAMTLAQSRYQGALRVIASFVALGIALIVGVILDTLLLAALVGVAAVPLAPIAKDLVTALQSAAQALRQR